MSEPVRTPASLCGPIAVSHLVVSAGPREAARARGHFPRIHVGLPVRLGIGITLVTLLSLTLLAALLFVQIRARLEARAESELERSQEMATELFARRGSDGFDEAADFHARLPTSHGLVVERLDLGGKYVSGTAVGLGCAPGFRDVVLDTTRTSDGSVMVAVEVERYWRYPALERFRVLSRRFGSRCLTFGRSLYELDSLIGNAFRMSYWAIPACLLPSLLVSGVVARRVRRRLREIGDVLRRVADGELSCRIRVSGIDEIDRLASGANRSFERLQGSVEALEQLSSTVAHDLKAPLARLAIPLEEALWKNREGRADPESLESVARGVEHLRATFEALLRISQIQSGRRRAGFREIRLRGLVDELVDIYAPVCEDAAMILVGPGSPDGPDGPDGPRILGDAELLRQAVVNLLENAIRYCPAGSTIRLAVDRDAAGVPRVTIGDDGPGIPTAERERVFVRLYRIAERGEGEERGTGLGLTLVRAVAELHEGSVTLHDAAPGLEVQFRLSAAVSHSAMAFARRSASHDPLGGSVPAATGRNRPGSRSMTVDCG